MKIVSPIILLICGVMALVGVFLPWVVGEVSGWDAISEFGINDATEPLLVFIGSILLLVFALSTVIVSANPKGSQKVVLTLNILASLRAALGIAGASWLISDVIINDGLDFLSYGFYVSYAAAVLGIIFGIIVSVRTATRI
jgi:hypothetical protein